MFCNICGNQVPEGSTFCNGCGSELPQASQAAGAPPANTRKPPYLPPPPPILSSGGMPPAMMKLSNEELFKKASIAFLIALLVVGGLATLIIVLMRTSKGGGITTLPQTQTEEEGGGLTTGTALTLTDYVQEMLPILQGTSSGLQTVKFANLAAANLDDQSIQELQTINQGLQVESATLQASSVEAQGIDPPEEASQLHTDITSFYATTLPLVKEVREASSYLIKMGQASLKMEGEMNAVQAQFDAVSTFDQLIPLIDTSYNSWNTYLQTLQAMTPPPSLASFHQLLVKASQDMVGIFTQLKTAALNQDNAAATSIAAQAEQLGNTYDENVQSTLQEVMNLGDQYDALNPELQTLIDRLNALD